MSKIFDLINELCPKGVKFDELGVICKSLAKGTLKQEDLVDKGAYPVVNSSRDYYGFYDKYNNEANAFTIASRGEYAGFVKFIDCKFWAGGLCYPYTSKDEDYVLTKFIFYFLKSIEKKNMDILVARGSIPALNKSDFDKVKIPVPPTEVQREIVRIMDSFTSLIEELMAKLTEELTARKKQYEFYRDFLLSFDELDKNGGCELKMLREMILNVSNIKWSNNDKIYNYIDLTSVDMQNHQIGNLSNISKEKHPSRAQQIVKFNDIIFATTRPMQKRIAMIPKYLDGQICSTGYCVLRVDEKIALSSWVYYVLCTSIFYDYVDKFQQGTSYPSISDNNVKKFKIPIPSLQTQQKVVEILDKFDTLVNSITEGLPREIELRRKQYEHYREILLNFKPKMTA